MNVLADLTMDGITYPGVGVQFKGMTSYMTTGNSQKKSFHVALDETDPNQTLMGYKTLTLNNSALDPSFIHEVLYFNVMRQYTTCPKANFVKLIINGENWGIYVNIEQNNSDLIKEWFQSSDGDRWKVGQNMGGMGGGAFPGGGAQQLSLTEWLASPTAQDMNGDGQITEEDFTAFNTSMTNRQGQPFGQPQQISLADWLASPAALDANGDGKITEEDYTMLIRLIPPWMTLDRLPKPQISFDDWAASSAAQDANGDGQITRDDYWMIMSNAWGPGGMVPGGMPGDDAIW